MHSLTGGINEMNRIELAKHCYVDTPRSREATSGEATERPGVWSDRKDAPIERTPETRL